MFFYQILIEIVKKKTCFSLENTIYYYWSNRPGLLFLLPRLLPMVLLIQAGT